MVMFVINQIPLLDRVLLYILLGTGYCHTIKLPVSSECSKEEFWRKAKILVADRQVRLPLSDLA